jgi:hypothetical protein
MNDKTKKRKMINKDLGNKTILLESILPSCGFSPPFELVRELDFPNQYCAGHQDSAKGGKFQFPHKQQGG